MISLWVTTWIAWNENYCSTMWVNRQINSWAIAGIRYKSQKFSYSGSRVRSSKSITSGTKSWATCSERKSPWSYINTALRTCKTFDKMSANSWLESKSGSSELQWGKKSQTQTIIHLKSEKQILYPCLESCGNRSIRCRSNEPINNGNIDFNVEARATYRLYSDTNRVLGEPSKVAQLKIWLARLQTKFKPENLVQKRSQTGFRKFQRQLDQRRASCLFRSSYNLVWKLIFSRCSEFKSFNKECLCMGLVILYET